METEPRRSTFERERVRTGPKTGKTPTTTAEVTVEKGSILVYRVFDIGEEVDLKVVEKYLRQGSGQTRLGFTRSGKNAVVMRNAPIRLSLGELDIPIGVETRRSEAFATIWDYGVLSVVFQIPIPKATPWSQLVAKASMIYGDVAGGEAIDLIAHKKSQEIIQYFSPALKHRNEWKVFEDYVIYFLEEVGGISKAIELTEKADVPALILGEAKEILAKKCRSGILESVYQYAENDLVAIDWNSAIVLEPSGQRDITDVIEFALTHLLEFRYYDDLLDRRLAMLYDAIGEKRNGLWKSNFGKISKEANTRYIEFSEFIERVDNSLKVVGDFYLAVIFRAAVRRFRIPDWQQSITRKMNLLARVSELLLGEINALRGHWLEFVIILLITFEIVSALVKGLG
jgi:hypothetical protein